MKGENMSCASRLTVEDSSSLVSKQEIDTFDNTIFSKINKLYVKTHTLQ